MNPPNGPRSAAAMIILMIPLLSSMLPAPTLAAGAKWLSPSTLAATPDGRALFVACVTGERVLVLDLATRRVTGSVPMPAPPTGLAVSADQTTLFVTCAAPESQVCIVDVAKGRITAKLPAGYSACAPVVSPDGKTLYVCNRFNNDVSVFDLAAKKETRRIAVRREPVAAAITPDGRRLLVANHLHTGRADAEHVGAVVSVIDTELGQVIDDLWLPSGSGLLNDLRISPDGKHAVVTHVLARFHLPTTQLERGWVNTNAKSLIDLDRMEVLNTVLLDNIDRGAANPWGAAWSADGQKLVVALAGTHEISVTDFPALLEKLAKLTPAFQPTVSGAYPVIGSRAPSDVPNDLSVLVGLRERRPLPEGDLGPRGVVVVGRVAYTANYFSDTLSAIELDGPYPKAATIPLGPKPTMTPERQGELNFNDARLCFQGWQSCASCHSDDARVDGLNWDLLNDGLGNPKNNKSLLLAFKTPPAMSTGVRESAEAAVRAGLTHILFTVQPPEVSEALGAYLKSLQPMPSPRLVKGKLSAAARRGEKLFNSRDVGCAQCHPGPLFTDLQSYDVGTRGPRDGATDLFDTPTLVEIWRTAPYLHDGSAATIRDVLTTSNKNNEHGKTSRLTADQLNDLCEYVLSL
jgi:YVTN family beta-propeller protein